MALSAQVAAAINAALREQAFEDCWRWYHQGWFYWYWRNRPLPDLMLDPRQ